MLQSGPSVPLWGVCILVVTMTLKHFIADFILQTNWIAHGKERRDGWFAPLAVHVLCHAVLTLGIVLCVAPRLWWLAIADLFVHAGIDRCKSLTARWGAWSPQQIQFWWLMGFDQFLHQITNLAIVVALLTL